MKKSPVKLLKYQFLYIFIRLMILLSNLLSRRVWLWFCGILGLLFYTFSGRERKRAIHHLSIAYKDEKSPQEIQKLARSTFVMLGKNAGEILRSAGFRSSEQLERILTTKGLEHLDAAVKSGKGVIFLTGHIGAFELMVTFFSTKYEDPYVIGTPLKDEKLNRLLWKQRGAHGAVPIERGKDMAKIFRHLKNGGIVAMLIDQDTKVKSTFVNFFGMPAATPVGAALLAQRTGAIVVPGAIHLGEDNLQHVTVMPPIPVVITGNEEEDLTINTQSFTTALEEFIREHPAQWVWLHRRWRTQPQ
jgi:KDO2-lipid IV(A) lauroyltransferase